MKATNLIDLNERAQFSTLPIWKRRRCPELATVSRIVAATVEALEGRMLLSAAVPGMLDPSFGIGGSVSTSFGNVTDAVLLYAMTLQPDGKVLATGYASQGHPPYTHASDFPLVRYNADGSLDPAFGQGGIAFLPGPNGGRAVAVQRDGKILVAVAGSEFTLIRATSTGALDPTFGTGGQVVTNIGGEDIADAIALQSDGKILLAGQSKGYAALARYLPDGSLDPSFGAGGTLVIASGLADANVMAMSLQADGKVDLITNNQEGGHGYLSRLNANGSSDTSFGNAGVVDTGFNANTLTVLRDGDVVAGGGATATGGATQAALAFYTPGGQLDPSRGNAGQVRTGFGMTGGYTSVADAITAIAQQRDDKIVVAANVYRNSTFPDGQALWGLARYTPGGQLDPTFGNNGISLSLNHGGAYNTNNVAGLALQTDGSIVLAGSPTFDGLSIFNSTFVVARYLNDPAGSLSGSVFNDLNGDGKWQTSEPGLAGRTVYLDLNRNGQLDPGEPTSTTDSTGSFTLGNLAPGLDYIVRQISPGGWRQTFPPDNFGIHADLVAGQHAIIAAFGDAGSAPIGSTPFLGHPFNVNTDTICADQFDSGGEGVAYHDTTPQNVNGQYRPTEGVDINTGGSNGYSVGYTAPGEWLKYTITAPAQCSYRLQATVANYLQGGTFHVEIDGTNVTGTMTIPNTGPWDTWQTLTSQAFTVSAGNHVMRVVMDQGGYWGNIGDFDTFRFVPAATPFHGTPFNITTDRIEAEDFDTGGEGVAYHDTTPQNINGQYRPTESVDINKGGSNGYSVGYTAPGEWLNFTINAPARGTYRLGAAVANFQQGGTFHVEIDGHNVTGIMSVPNTGPWDTWQTIVSPQAFTVSAGNHVMRVVMDQPGYWGNIGDFDYFQFLPSGVVTLVSQQRSVTIASISQTAPVTQTAQTAPADFGPFNQSLQSTDFYFPTGTAMASQSSTLTVTDTGANISASGLAGKANVMSATGADASFQVVFDVYSPVGYTLTFSGSHNPRYQRTTATFQGPNGVLKIDPVDFQTPGYVSTGTLQAGMYTLTTGAFGGQQFDLEMIIGTA